MANANFTTWNGNELANYLTLSQGNVKVLGNTSADASGVNTTMAVSSGKWYVEFYLIRTGSNYPYISLSSGASAEKLGTNTGYRGEIRFHAPNSTGMGNNTGSSNMTNNWGTITLTETGVDACNNGDIIGFALDMDNKKLFISRNGTFFNSGNPASGTYPQASWTVNPKQVYFNCFSYTSSRGCIINAGQDSTFLGNVSAGSYSDSNSIGSFKYEVPSGFLSLSSANAVTSADIDASLTDDDIPSKQFNTITYTGNGGTNAISNLGFSPDLVWLKRTDSSASHQLYDSNRGTGKLISSNTNDAEQTVSTGVNSFDSDGFTLGSAGGANASGATFVAWCWRAGGSAVSDSSGSITVTRSTNTKSGFSIIKYTGTGSNLTIAHGLTKAPEFIAVKNLSSGNDWNIYHVSTGYTGYFKFNTSEPFGANSDVWYAEPTTSVINIGNAGTSINGSGSNYICYAWHGVDGYSKFSSFTGNGSTNGSVIHLGFRPRMIFFKRSDGGSEPWTVFDTARATHNPTSVHSTSQIYWDFSSAGSSGSTHAIDFLSNGVKLKGTGGANNNSGSKYIYGAWGDHSEKFSNAFA